MDERYVIRQVQALVDQAKALLAQAEALAEAHDIYINVSDVVSGYRTVEESWNSSNC